MLVQQWISTDLQKLTLDSLKRAKRTRKLGSPASGYRAEEANSNRARGS
jgi:hypothetical protein